MQLGVGIKTDEDRRLAKLLQTPKGYLDWSAAANFLDIRIWREDAREDFERGRAPVKT
jgi:hypothetical protein